MVKYSRQLAKSEVGFYVCFIRNLPTRLIRWWPRLWRDGVMWLHSHGGKGPGRRISGSAGIRENLFVKNLNFKTKVNVSAGDENKSPNLSYQTQHKTKAKLLHWTASSSWRFPFVARSTWNRERNTLGYAYFPTDGRLHMNDAKQLTAGKSVTEVLVLITNAWKYMHPLFPDSDAWTRQRHKNLKLSG